MNLKKIFQCISILLAANLFFSCNSPKFEIIIKNGTVYDGNGNTPVSIDIGIRDGHIAVLGKDLKSGKAAIIDASGLIVAPGFIDIHTHCDDEILEKGMNSMENYLMQGVTTVVGGNCGSGTYLVKKFFSTLDSIGIGANMIHLVGHNTVREKVMGMENRKPDSAEMEQMKKMVATAMEEGAGGLATGLFYLPGNYSSTDEVVALAKVAVKYNGFYATHLRDESDYSVGLKESVREALNIGEQAGIRVEIAHIKALGKPVWGMSADIAAMIEDAKSKGVNVFADQYPYEASNTGLSAATLPVWVSVDGKMRERLNDKKLLPRIKKEMEENIDRRGGPASLVIVSYQPDRRFDGKSLSEIGKIIGKSPVETALQLILEASPSIISFNMQESDILNFMKKDYVMTASDGSLVRPGQGMPHPRSYGTFPRKIRKYVLEDKILTMEQAIKKCTSMPANMAGLKDRGVMKEGNVADIVIFNPATIKDNATYTDPHQYSSGIEYLVINGEVVIEGGKYNGKLAGKAIRMKNY
jgi:N-acyl-D-aspartate/D-glutamate deacylase